MRNKAAAVVLTLVLWLAGAANAAAEVWLCAGKLFTTTRQNGQACEPLRNQVVCGREGNKYFAPYRPGVRDARQSCEEADAARETRAGPAQSPLVNVRFAELYRDYHAQPTKRFSQPSAAAEATVPDQLALGVLGKTGMNALPQIFDLIQTATRSLDTLP